LATDDVKNGGAEVLEILLNFCNGFENYNEMYRVDRELNNRDTYYN